ncbi:putative methyltransferase [Echinococcus granulosus]|uniref:Methyltransferase n=1 Tax=Echinococcus granulosus TaxID=6210 RepID=W6UCE6_ECHGR|nr:putative methyltransferase [Echinococcus granulosus]EUB58376.1 putative methyltransferase [Echinococcus granulosus]
MLRVSRTLFFTTIRHAQCYQARSFCASSLPIFDRKSKKLQRARTSLRAKPSLYDYLRDEAAFRIADRICDITRVFDIAAEVGCGRGHLIQNLTSDSVKFLYQCDNCVEILVLRALKPDGCFLGVTFTTDTLFELRVSLQLAETERLGGFYPHISPFVESARFGELLRECGFSLISLDVDDVEVLYPSMFELIDDLRGMGESNAAISRPLRLNRDVLFAASSIYDDRFGTQRGDGEERCVPATFRFLFFIAWKPDPSQAKPLPRGSGEFSLRDIGRLDELSAELEKRHSRKPE